MKVHTVTARRWLPLAASLSLGAALGGCGTVPVVQAHEQWQEENEELVVNEQGVTCGSERWSVKTGSDADASRINLSSVTTTIGTLAGYARPSSLPDNNRVSPVELTTYRLRNVTMTGYKLEPDSDIHIVVSSGGQSMIVEMPHTGCVSTSSPLYSRIQSARNAFLSTHSATSTYKTTNETVTVLGVGFWDYNHGQTGVAANAIELHAVTFFCSGLDC
jgi:hypothetical protein